MRPYPVSRVRPVAATYSACRLPRPERYEAFLWALALVRRHEELLAEALPGFFDDEQVAKAREELVYSPVIWTRGGV